MNDLLEHLPDNPYLLLTPGPLSTTKTVKSTMLRDWCTWDREYNDIVQDIRSQLVRLATSAPGYTAVLMQGSGTFAVEATITTMVPDSGKLLVLANGAYGRRMATIAERCRISFRLEDYGELAAPDPEGVAAILAEDSSISHVAVVHCETTTGMLNPLAAIGRAVKKAGRVYLVDAMSSFGGIPMDMAEIGADFLVSSANKCIQGVPGFGFVLAKQEELEKTAGRARSLSLDLHDQWRIMESQGGKWRFTSPTHVVRAFAQALLELQEEGGIAARHRRYRENQGMLDRGMAELGFRRLLPSHLQSPIITAFHSPEAAGYNFQDFYQRLKTLGFVIYPGKVSDHDTFRIGTIGAVGPQDIQRLLEAVGKAKSWC
jgi:2-aminoethylphosphonate-pyruvate transaminase